MKIKVSCCWTCQIASLTKVNECRTGQFCPSENWSRGCGAAGRSEHLIPREAAVDQEYHVMCEAGGR